jgi:bifunctional enzyme CysN/CysC
MDLLRFSTAGSVDDGKSTLIGRLLYDTKSIFEDQLDAVHRASRALGEDQVNLALLTDGLRAEREQKITIDVAYRFFATPTRSFIIADTPGHVQYTRNMVTGASTADLVVILIDATKGVLPQSRRHAFISSLLGIRHAVVAVNKMDLVGFDQARFDELAREFRRFASALAFRTLDLVPLSALQGDNVVEPSARMPWYGGGTLLHLLEHAPLEARPAAAPLRLPVQYVARPHQQFRGYAGTVAAGAVAPGQDVVVLPSGAATRIKTVDACGDAVMVTTEDEVDISRGDMLAGPEGRPDIVTRVAAHLCWMAAEPLAAGRPYVLMHTCRQVQAFVTHVDHKINVDTLERVPAESLDLNDIGHVEVSLAQPICADPYRVNRTTGGFILIDPQTNATVAAGMIDGDTAAARPVSSDVTWQPWNIAREERERGAGHLAAAIWLTGLSGAGKTTIARALERRLFERGCRTMLLDGDQLRHGLCGDLGFSPADRAENIRRAGEVARLFFEQGSIVLCAFVSPYRADRDRARSLFPEGRFLEVFVSASRETCRARDPKGLYRKAADGSITQFTGLSAPYEIPVAPELILDTEQMTVTASVDRLIAELAARGVIVLR